MAGICERGLVTVVTLILILRFSRGLIGGVLALRSFQEYFGLDKKSAAERANLNGNIVSILQAGCL